MWTVIEKVVKGEGSAAGCVEGIQNAVLGMRGQVTPLAGTGDHLVRDGVGRGCHEIMIPESMGMQDLFDRLRSSVVFG